MASPLFKRAMRVIPTFFRPYPLQFSSAASSDADPNDVVSSVTSILTSYRSKSRWYTILNHCPKGLTPLQVSNVLLRVRNNPTLAASFFRFTSENAMTCHDLQSYSTIIHIVARARLKSRAKTLMRTAILTCASDEEKPSLFVALVKTYKSCQSSPLVFDVLIQVYLELNRIDSCLYILRMLPSDGFKPTLKTCNLLVSAVARHKGAAIGFDLYMSLFVDNQRANLRPDAATFNDLLAACHNQRLLDKAREIWIEMKRLDCNPNYRTYNILMAAYCEKEDMEKAGELWKEMKSMGLKREIFAYNTLIGGWCRIGNVDIGEELYKEMKFAEIEPNNVTYEHLINGYCKFGDASSAYLLFKEMCRKEFSLDVFIVDLLVIELCKEGMVSEALQVFRQVMKDANFGCRRSSYEFLIKGLCGNGEMEEALKVQAEMVGKGFEPDHSVYTAFVDGYTKLGEMDMADKLREEMNRTLC